MEKKRKTTKAVGVEAKKTPKEPKPPVVDKPEFDVMTPAGARFAPVPSGPDGIFVARGKEYNIKGRLGDGPCTVLPKGPVMMPNGDLADPGDTFDPVVERMSPARYSSLLSRKYITAAGDAVERELLARG